MGSSGEGLKRPPGNIRRPTGLKIACFRNGPVRPGYGRLALASEGVESKLLFHQRNKQIVAGRTLFIPFQLPLSPNACLTEEREIDAYLSVHPDEER